MNGYLQSSKAYMTTNIARLEMEHTEPLKLRTRNQMRKSSFQLPLALDILGSAECSVRRRSRPSAARGGHGAQGEILNEKAPAPAKENQHELG